MWIRKNDIELKESKEKARKSLQLPISILAIGSISIITGYFLRPNHINPNRHPTAERFVPFSILAIIGCFILALIAYLLQRFVFKKDFAEKDPTGFCESCNKTQTITEDNRCNQCGGEIEELNKFKWVENNGTQDGIKNISANL
jgi:hypothetical protein